MIVFRVMDHTGDTRTEFNTDDAAEAKVAAERFEELTGKGYRAAVPGDNGQPGDIIKTFDPTAKEMLFIPRLQGG